ncbi:hypothetical protein [Limosilactobacillus fermentum]|uniref:hypothetical protein n=1 Tax=Limosilactobacillus fermentum TaxID=1613 RepID=UPI0013637DBA|nr:hypothetical protein [Limosilactobacillus fermentum]MCT3455148.1 hypothetical protein [Limosilactobacillus fermentum]MCT3461272.1 hypothetical protein [Limosilactobacillus fermentum]MCZ2327106.1 hypothetical protein [Limosilactobacillus fermentum]
MKANINNEIKDDVKPIHADAGSTVVQKIYLCSEERANKLIKSLDKISFALYMIAILIFQLVILTMVIFSRRYLF